VVQRSVEDVCSDKARSLLQGLLQEDPKRRPTAADAMQHPWVQDSGSSASNNDRPLLIQSRDNNALLHAFDEPLLAGLDTNFLPHREAQTVDVPLAVDLNVLPAPACMQHPV